MNRVFLDANVLFSAAYGSPRLGDLWILARRRQHELLASAHTVEEARRNLSPDRQAVLHELTRALTIVPTPPADLPSPIDLPAGDREAFLSALAARTTHFLTGDIKHFGRYIGRSTAGVLIQTPGDYLRTQKK